jgi:hypothetical protein
VHTDPTPSPHMAPSDQPEDLLSVSAKSFAELLRAPAPLQVTYRSSSDLQAKRASDDQLLNLICLTCALMVVGTD